MGARKLLRMARKGGVILTLPEAKKHLEVFHAAYPEIRIFHKALETAAKQAIKYKQDVAVGRLLLKGSDRRYLEILLPSGRSMFYQRPRLSFDEYGDGAKITYIQSGKKGTYGAMLAENVVQGIARDLLYGALLACERAGLEVCFHVHDEIVISASEENASAAKSTLDEIMSRSPDWAPDLPLAVESKIVPYFQK
jgi:DNA polymerase